MLLAGLGVYLFSRYELQLKKEQIINCKIKANEINEAYERTIKGQVKYRFVVDAKTF
jgi:D-arabinose 1-dehydrogenase-like Zn-dependent alcohol dehydrogenase